MQFQLFIFRKPPCLQRNFHGRPLSIRAFSADGHYGLIVESFSKPRRRRRRERHQTKGLMGRTMAVHLRFES